MIVRTWASYNRKLILVFSLAMHPQRKHFEIYNQRTKRIIETIHVDFDELKELASEYSSLEPALHEMTPTTISLGLVPDTPPLTPYAPPSRSNWDILFQPLFNELLTPPPSVDPPAPEVIALIIEVVAPAPAALTDSPSLTTVDQDAPSAIEPKNYKDALNQACWIEAMQEELNEFERLEVWEIVPHPDKVMVITLKWIYKVKLTTFLNGILREEVYVSQPNGFMDQDNPNHVYKLKKALYGLKQAPRTWYDLLSKFLLSQEFFKGTTDPTLFIRRQGKDILLAKPTEKHLHAVKRIFKYLQGTINKGLWYPNNSSIALTAYADADHAGCQDTRRSTSRKRNALIWDLIDFGVTISNSLKGGVLRISGLYTPRLIDAACKKVLNLLKEGLLI
nr:hypothetical protein [Tanacetum cinerariifolium]